ncbi:hypothetical protein ACS0TY_028886 [Phlomoides rotata]
MVSNSTPHIILFPFMSKGHTIPLLHLAHLLLRRGAAVTIFTTQQNHPFISHSLPTSNNVSIVDLPFPANIPGIPPGIENTENLPSTSDLFLPFVNGVKLMQPFFEEELRKIHVQVTCLVSDGFLPWTLQSASRFGIPRLSFYGMSYYAHAVSYEAGKSGSLSLHERDDEPFSLSRFPWIELTRNDFDEPFNQRHAAGPHMDFIYECGISTANSYGLLVNSFYELEPLYADYSTRESGPKAWSVGPLCLAKIEKNKLGHRPDWMDWLDKKSGQGSRVLYVAFGSQVKISLNQLREIAVGLKEANVSFLWVMKKGKLEEGFEEEVRERGMIVNGWVDQEQILEHPIVQGFLSHCGWNSILEGVCSGVPILGWPMMAEQWLNAKMVVEEIKVGLRVKTVDGSAKGFVGAESLKKSVVELMEGEEGERVRENVKKVAEAAKKAVANGGSSWHALNDLISETQKQKGVN